MNVELEALPRIHISLSNEEATLLLEVMEFADVEMDSNNDIAKVIVELRCELEALLT